MRIGLGQINAIVGDLSGNAGKIIAASHEALARGCALLVTPELAITGYPPQDLLFKKHFVDAQLEMLRERVASSLEIPALVGFVDRDASGNLYNAAAFIESGRIQAVIHKTLLPTYDVFDELRYFTPADSWKPIQIGGMRVGVTICEDIWDSKYGDKIVPKLAEAGAEIVINLSSSPFHAGKRLERIELLRSHSLAYGIPMLYCNMVGAQDELIFDGESMAVNAKGRLVALGRQFEEDLVTIDCGTDSASDESVDSGQEGGNKGFFSMDSEIEVPPVHYERETLRALSLGISDYFRKCGFARAVIGLSGGIDSALTTCIAVDALGPEQVIGVTMPSKFTADYSTSDAELLAQNLGIRFHVLPIEESMRVATRRFTDEFGAYRNNVTVENLQARERGKILMEISNDINALVLATGNKTEYALGYSTLYGDMCGGIAVIGDVSKPEVYALARYINESRDREVIPYRTIERPPSAELKDDQVDPFDYERIGPLADAVVEEFSSPEELAAQGYSNEEIELVVRLVYASEYKRRQAPTILRVTPRAFGIGRKMPIINRFTL